MSGFNKQLRRISFQKCYKGSPCNSKIVSQLNWGTIGLRSLELGRFSSLQLAVAVRFLLHYLRRGAQLIIRVFPDRPVTVTSIGTRIGKGKGSVSFWCTYVKKGQIIFELYGIDSILGAMAFRMVKAKLPFTSNLVFRRLALKLVFILSRGNLSSSKRSTDFSFIGKVAELVIALGCKPSCGFYAHCGFKSHFSQNKIIVY